MAKLEMVDKDMYTAGHNREKDAKDTELRKAVRRACKKVIRTRTAAVNRFIERYVKEMEEQLRVTRE